MINKESKFETGFFITCCLLIFIYLILRAINVGLVNDESATFMTFVHTGDFLPYSEFTQFSANNHLLNTLLIWINWKLFGLSEWIIRLPNLLAFIFYAWYIRKIGLLLSASFLKWMFWILMFGVHYYMEFFAYARGYGLGMAFLSGSVYHLVISDHQNNKFRNLYLSFLWMTLAVLANLNLIVSYLIWIGLVQIPLWRKFNVWRNILFLVISIAPMLFFISWSLTLKESEELYFGQVSLSGTLYTLITKFTGIQGTSTFYIVIPVLLFLLIGGTYKLSKKGLLRLDGHSVFYWFATLNILAAVVMHYLLGINYPSERTGLHWYFFVAGLLPFTIDAFPFPFKSSIATLGFIVSLPLVFYSVASLNLNYSVDPYWRKEQLPDTFLETIESENQDFPASIHASTSFYTFNMAFKALEHQSDINITDDFPPSDPLYIADLVIIDLKEYPGYKDGYLEVLKDGISGMTLMKRSPMLERVPLADSSFNNYQPADGDFTPLLDFNNPQVLGGKPIRVDYDLTLTSESRPFVSLLTIEVRDTADNVIGYKQARLDYYKTDYSGGTRHRVSLLLKKLPAEAGTIRTYLWNKKGETFIINSADIRLYELKEPSYVAR